MALQDPRDDRPDWFSRPGQGPSGQDWARKLARLARREPRRADAPSRYDTVMAILGAIILLVLLAAFVAHRLGFF